MEELTRQEVIEILEKFIRVKADNKTLEKIFNKIFKVKIKLEGEVFELTKAGKAEFENYIFKQS